MFLIDIFCLSLGHHPEGQWYRAFTSSVHGYEEVELSSGPVDLRALSLLDALPRLLQRSVELERFLLLRSQPPFRGQSLAFSIEPSSTTPTSYLNAPVLGCFPSREYSDSSSLSGLNLSTTSALRYVPSRASRQEFPTRPAVVAHVRRLSELQKSDQMAQRHRAEVLQKCWGDIIGVLHLTVPTKKSFQRSS